MKLKRNELQLAEVLKFLVGGGSAVLTDYAVYQLLLKAGWHISPAKALSYVCGAAVGFVINKLWTFASRKFSGLEIVKYSLLYVCSACINAAVNRIVLLVLPMQVFGFFCATACSTVINFLGQKFFVFANDDRTGSRNS